METPKPIEKLTLSATTLPTTTLFTTTGHPG
jgi:hypothetical protein